MQRLRLIITGYFIGVSLHYLDTGETKAFVFSLIMTIFFGSVAIVDKVTAND